MNFRFLRIFSFLSSRFTFWRGNVFDIRDLALVALLVLFFSPVLPWHPRGKRYLIKLPYEEVQSLADIYDDKRFEADYKRLILKYQSIQDPGLRKCMLGRDVIIPMIFHSQKKDLVASGLLSSAFVPYESSNVPAILLIESAAKYPMYTILSAIRLPRYDSIIHRVASHCSPYPGSYLTPSDAQIFGK